MLLTKTALVFVLLGTVGVFVGLSFSDSAYAVPAAATVENIEPYEIPTDPWEEAPAGKVNNPTLEEGDPTGDSLAFEPLPATKHSFKDAAPVEAETDKPTDPFDGESLERLFSKSKPVIAGKDSLRMILALAIVLALVFTFFKWVFPKILPLLARAQQPSPPKMSRPSRKAMSPSRTSPQQQLIAGSQESRPYEVLRSFPVHKHTRIELVSVWERYLLVGATREGSVSLGEVHPPDASDRQSQSWFEPTRTPQGEPISDVLQRHPAILQACLDCITERVFPPMLPSNPSPIPTTEENPATYPSTPLAGLIPEPFYPQPHSPYPSYHSTPAETLPSLNPEVWSVLNKYLPNAGQPPTTLPPAPKQAPKQAPRSAPNSPPAPYSHVIETPPLRQEAIPLPPAPPQPLEPAYQQPPAPPPQSFVATPSPSPLPTPKAASPKELPPALPLPPPPLAPPTPLPEPEFITVLDDYDDIF